MTGRRRLALIGAVIATLCVVAALVVVPLVRRGPAPPQVVSQEEDSGRFDTFTDDISGRPQPETDLDAVTRRMPGVRASEAHVVSRYREDEYDSEPNPGDPYWFHAVLTTGTDTTTALADAASGPVENLPAVHPELYQYVPEECSFTSVPARRANTILRTADADLGEKTEGFHVKELAVSRDCDLVVMTGVGGRYQSTLPL